MMYTSQVQRRWLRAASVLLLLLNGFHHTESLIVPQELPSILSLVYSNIPPIKKGTDSRLGFGFRLGEHADFQVMLELGPQKETKPLGDQDSMDSSFSKRQVDKMEQRLALQRQLLREQKLQHMTSTERTANNWLESWSSNMNASKKQSKQKPRTTSKKQHEKSGVLPTMPVLPQQSLRQLQLLYKMASSTQAPIIVAESTTGEKENSSPPLKADIRPFVGGRLNLGGPAGFTARPLELQQHTEEKMKTQDEITKDLMDVSLEDATK